MSDEAIDLAPLRKALAWRQWRELRNFTSHAYDEVKAEQVAARAQVFAADAADLLKALEATA